MERGDDELEGRVRDRRALWIVVVLAFGVLVAFVGGGWVALGIGASGSGSTSKSKSAAGPDAVEMTRQGICKQLCRVTDQTNFVHPKWGRSVLFVTMPADGVEGFEVNLVVINSAGEVKWHYSAEWPELKIATPAQDVTGKIFVNYNPGRYDGVIILQPSSDSFVTFGSLPPAGDYRARFYSAVLRDDDRDGIYEIVQSHNDCEPSCAEGKITNVTYRWAGTDYEKR
ncbi:hypothetical protein ACN265_18780 [Micromonospora sp. WMMD730]|uniref:hypothetical protein n=1 Tax=Micromonospora sp. WMMD730 TaxID=3404128 RepID=UPI003B9392CA